MELPDDAQTVYLYKNDGAQFFGIALRADPAVLQTAAPDAAFGFEHSH